MPLAVDDVGTGYEIGVDPVSGLVNIAAGPATSRAISYSFI
jgi:hypothetical protein